MVIVQWKIINLIDILISGKILGNIFLKSIKRNRLTSLHRSTNVLVLIFMAALLWHQKFLRL